ncbi:hypothetical protein BC939DRAFT_52205 [Gamsiella multidivaricata]|uniref:uncharacterized protein n=1 Tax=Gamsiella multidivaricata TaxID=101098 RepID=UPI00221E420E|nr:uncharacterized protein BC939DRAFT_52205 [Gamsiella multidivaricata]KAI7828866.1 hypothetical protein BC939DRAFT_52205 [Gamsiella multidivaricata]
MTRIDVCILHDCMHFFFITEKKKISIKRKIIKKLYKYVEGCNEIMEYGNRKECWRNIQPACKGDICQSSRRTKGWNKKKGI